MLIVEAENGRIYQKVKNLTLRLRSMAIWQNFVPHVLIYILSGFL